MVDNRRFLEGLWKEFPSLNLPSFFISYSDLQEILTPELAVREVERAYRYLGEKGKKVQMPQKQYFFYPDGDMRVMPTVVEMDFRAITGVKIISVHFGNRERGLPTVIGYFVLTDSDTGGLSCVMDATYLTAMRTGGAGAVSAKYLLAPKKIKMGIIGCGVQARTQLVLTSVVKTIDEVVIYDISSEAVENFRRFAESIGFKVKVANSLEEFSDCDLITTLTPSREPFLRKEHVKNAKLINAMGADGPGKRELEPDILLDSIVVVDNVEQAIHGGEINVPVKMGVFSKDKIFAELGEIVAGKKDVERDDRRIIFDSTGIALLDVFVGYAVFEEAKKRGKLRRFSIH